MVVNNTKDTLSLVKPRIRETFWLRATTAQTMAFWKPTDCSLWSEKGQDMSTTQTEEFIRLVRKVLDSSDTHDDKYKLQESVREWLVETFTDDCQQCRDAREPQKDW